MKLKILSSLAKVFLDEEPADCPPARNLSGFRNERLSFQVAYAADDARYDGRARLGVAGAPYVRLQIDGAPPSAFRVRRVQQVGVALPTFPDADGDYLRKQPGLYPDILQDLDECRLRMPYRQWQCAWVDVEPGALDSGEYDLTLRLIADDGAELMRGGMHLSILPLDLPEQEILHTKWFHADALAQYYGVEVFSERHWQIIEEFAACAARRGMNMILTPIHTPPLDTEIGAERPTVQLVDVFVDGGVYSFGFEKLRRWVALCQRQGIRYFEMAHLFTQWGAACPPKIEAVVDGARRRVFGWDTPAGDEYRAFLDAYLPALVFELRDLGIAERCYFHISDDPDPQRLDGYLRAKAMVAGHLRGFPLFDALTYVELYQSGAVQRPVASNASIQAFLDAGCDHLWTYCCVEQYKEVGNLFIAMPSVRHRVFGAQLYKYGLEGFLHWGYNFYYARHSAYPINPFLTCDGDATWPAGDPFQVYPGADGRPLDSLRHMVVAQAMQDHRALKLLERLAGREAALALIDEGLARPLTFADYPRDAEYLLALREKVNAAIMKKWEEGK